MSGLEGTRGEKVSQLPPFARSEIVRLFTEADELDRGMRELQRSVNELRTAAANGDAYIRRLTTSRGVHETDTVVAMARAEVEASRHRIADLEKVIAGRREKHSILSVLKQSVLETIDRLPFDMRAVHFEQPMPKLSKNETPLQAIERVQNQLMLIQSEADQVSNSPLHSSEVKTRWRAQVEQLADGFKPDVFEAIEEGREIRFPTVPVVSVDASAQDGRRVVETEQIDVIAALAYFFKNTVIEAIDKEIDSRADDENAMSRKDQREALKRLKADRLRAEREECSLIRAARAAGLTVEFRAAVSPFAFLSIAEEFVPAAQAKGLRK